MPSDSAAATTTRVGAWGRGLAHPPAPEPASKTLQNRVPGRSRAWLRSCTEGAQKTGMSDWAEAAPSGGPVDFMGHESEITEAILGYLAEHPRAMDTLEGIAGWWLTRRHVRVEVNAVARALDELTDDGLLEKIGTGRDTLYLLKDSHNKV